MSDDAIYYLCTADQAGHETLVTITKHMSALRKVVESLIHDRLVKYLGDGMEDNTTTQEQLRQLREDWNVLSRTELNDRLHGVTIRVTQDGDMI